MGESEDNFEERVGNIAGTPGRWSLGVFNLEPFVPHDGSQCVTYLLRTEICPRLKSAVQVRNCDKAVQLLSSAVCIPVPLAEPHCLFSLQCPPLLRLQPVQTPLRVLRLKSNFLNKKKSQALTLTF